MGVRLVFVLSSAERKIITLQQTKWLATRNSESNGESIPGILKKSSSPLRSTTSREKAKGKKTIVLEDMYPLFKKAKVSKDTGGIHDFVEILKLYDKNSDKTMLSKDLFRLLTNLGEKLTK